jgi:hypothetical protein
MGGVTMATAPEVEAFCRGYAFAIHQATLAVDDLFASVAQLVVEGEWEADGHQPRTGTLDRLIEADESARLVGRRLRELRESGVAQSLALFELERA